MQSPGPIVTKKHCTTHRAALTCAGAHVGAFIGATHDDACNEAAYQGVEALGHADEELLGEWERREEEVRGRSEVRCDGGLTLKMSQA